MTLFTQAQRKRLLKNGSPEQRGKDHQPVVKLILIRSHLTILLTEIDNEEPHLAFGLCDLNTGHPELGYVDVHELSELQNGDGYKVECDHSFIATQPISVYTSAAKHFNAITCDADELEEQGSFFFSRHDHP